jgi:outer membrane receptor protein involved in Fe transport
MKFSYLAAGLFAGASLTVMASAAQAQAAPQAASDAVSAEEVIVVTGSRVIQNGNNAPTPVTVVTTDQLLQTMPSNIQDGLQSLPVFSGGRSSTTNPGNSSQNNAAHTLNLRNIGITRNLVMFDFKRVAPTSPLGEVNADFIPSMLLQRVDVVTGGASAVYGSDAVSGVVNFVTDRKFNGIKADFSVGISQEGDAPNLRAGIAGGKQLTDRLHVEGSFEIFDQPGVFSRLSRDFGRRVLTLQGAGSQVNPFRVIENTRISNSSFVGLITNITSNGALKDMQFSSNGVLTPFVHGAASGSSNIESGGDGAYYATSSLQSLYRSKQAFGRLDYDLTDDVHAFVEVVGNWTHNMNNHQLNEVRNIKLSVCNAFLAATYRSQLGCTNANAVPTAAAPITSNELGTFTFSKMLLNAPTLQPESRTSGYMALAGLEGTIGKFKWELGYTRQSSIQNTRNNANISVQRELAALDAVRDSSGNIVCRVTLTNPGLYPGCVPLNLFGPNSESQAAINYILQTTSYRARTSMDDISASIAGSPFDTWAGPLQVAISGEWRKLGYALTSDAQPIAPNCTGLYTQFSCGSGTWALQYISNVLANRTPVSQSVSELAAEVDVPLLKDVPFFQSLNLNAAGRYTHYDTSGTVYTWKLGVDWHVNDDISFRATRSRDIRAPNLNELFAPTLINPAGSIDYHVPGPNSPTNVQANFNILSNPNLKPEVAQTWTAGVVLKPSFIPRFSLAVDWYSIKINNAITTVSGNNVTIQLACENSGGTDPFCALIHRPLPFSDRTTANLATSFDQLPLNAQTLKTHGVDVEANWSTPLGGGNLALRGLASFQPELISVAFPGAAVLNNAGTNTGGAATPQTKAQLFLKYTIGKFMFDLQESYRSKIYWQADRSLVVRDAPTPPAAYTNVTFTLNLKPVSVFFNVKNVFNKYVPWGGSGATVPGLFGGFLDDPLGRYFTIGARARF